MKDDTLLGKIKERNRLYALQLKGTGAGVESLRRLTFEVNLLRRDLKRTYFARRLSEAGRDSRAMWKVLYSFIDRREKTGSSCRTFFRNGVPVTRDSDIAGAFCDFFSQIGSELASNVRKPATGSFRDYLGPRAGPSVFFSPTSPGEIQWLCQTLDANKGSGHDNIFPSVLRFVSAEISAPLSSMINSCLEAWYFPDFLKVARVTPVFKDGDPTQLSNYRPISVLPAISKIFERVINERQVHFLQRQGSILNGCCCCCLATSPVRWQPQIIMTVSRHHKLTPRSGELELDDDGEEGGVGSISG